MMRVLKWRVCRLVWFDDAGLKMERVCMSDVEQVGR
jgi:hypothetical protein